MKIFNKLKAILYRIIPGYGDYKERKFFKEIDKIAKKNGFIKWNPKKENQYEVRKTDISLIPKSSLEYIEDDYDPTLEYIEDDYDPTLELGRDDW